MKDYDKYYKENLYPLQNGVLNLVKKLKTPFFLTGGTALSRFRYNHRYSDDLDFFVIDDSNYNQYVQKILKAFSSNKLIQLNLENVNIGKSFTRIYLNPSKNNEISLQVDFINDIAKYFGKVLSHKEFGQIDNWRNILSNKLTALFRSEPKDVVDIWIISKNERFNWEELLNEAKAKESGINPEIVYEMLNSFPISYIENIKWISGFNYSEFEKDIKIIAEEILLGQDNSLVIRK